MDLVPPVGAEVPRPALALDERALLDWWRRHIGSAVSLDVLQFAGGQSNPTYWVSDRRRSFVLRKKPPGKLLPSAHAVEREYRVMRALAETEVPVPEVIALELDDSVLGTPFFVMEHVEGTIFWNVQLPGLDPEGRRAVYDEFAKVLAALHRVDVDAVGLQDFGKQGGYVVRQVKRWAKQYEVSKTEDVASMDALIAFLESSLPSDDQTTLTHGDFRLDNVVFAVGPEKRAVAVLDWELSTLGHPLADLAYVCMLYDTELPHVGGLLDVDFAEAGIPSEARFVERYEELAGRRVDPDTWVYFKAFSLFRLAAIAQGVYRRSLEGNASSSKAAMFRRAVPHLTGIACRLAGISRS